MSGALESYPQTPEMYQQIEANEDSELAVDSYNENMPKQLGQHGQLKEWVCEDELEKSSLDEELHSDQEKVEVQGSFARSAGGKLDERVSQVESIKKREEDRRENFNSRMQANLSWRRQIVEKWQHHISTIRVAYTDVLSQVHGRSEELCTNLTETFTQLEELESKISEVKNTQEQLGPTLPKLKRADQAAEAKFEKFDQAMKGLIERRKVDLEANSRRIQQSGSQYEKDNQMRVFEEYGGQYDKLAEEEVRRDLADKKRAVVGYPNGSDFLRRYDQARDQYEDVHNRLNNLMSQLRDLSGRESELTNSRYELLAHKDDLIEATFDGVVEQSQELRSQHETIQSMEDEIKKESERNYAEYIALTEEAETFDEPLVPADHRAVQHAMVEQLKAHGINPNHLPGNLEGLAKRISDSFEPTPETAGEVISQALVEAGLENVPASNEATEQAIEAIVFQRQFEIGDLPDEMVSGLLRAVIARKWGRSMDKDPLELIGKFVEAAYKRERHSLGTPTTEEDDENSRSIAAPQDSTSSPWLYASDGVALQTAGERANQS